MAQNQSLLLRTRIITAGLVCLCFIAVLISSCTKKNDVSPFVGTYTKVSNDCSSLSNALTIYAGSSSSQVTFIDTVGSGNCIHNVTFVCNTNGNNLTIPATTYSDNCGSSTVIASGSAILTGKTITLTMNYDLTNPVIQHYITVCHYVGTKK